MWFKESEQQGSPSLSLFNLAVSVHQEKSVWDFPGGAVVKNPPSNSGDTGLSSGLGRSHMPRSN